MKDLIKAAAETLMQKNGKTTTLEVKNYLHAESSDPSFSLTQSEVSLTMRTLAKEEDWNSELTTLSGGSTKFFGYSIKPGTQSNGSLPAAVAVPIVNKIAPDNIVCYVAGHPNLFASAPNRRTARKLAFETYRKTLPNLSYDNINTCSSKFYMKHKI